MFPRLPKSLIIFCLVFVAVLVFSLVNSNTATAAAREGARPDIKVNFGSFTIANFTPITFPEKGGGEVAIPWIGEYIGGWYRYLVGIAGILAVIMIMVGGVFWLLAGGSPDKIGRAKEYITGALTGLVLALFSYVLLYTLNPRLTTFEPINVPVVAGTNINALLKCGSGYEEKSKSSCSQNRLDEDKYCFLKMGEICCCPTGELPDCSALSKGECESDVYKNYCFWDDVFRCLPRLRF